MKLEWRSRLWKACFTAGCLLGMGLYLWLAFRAFRASHLAAVPDSSNLQRAIRMEPSNAEYRDLLGRDLALSVEHLDDAIANYRMAAQLNPYSAKYWLDLASAYQLAGRTEEQGESVEKAVEADPTTPHVAWEAANFFLLQGDKERALRHFRVVLDNDSEVTDATLLLCWRTSGDADVILQQALSPRADLYLAFLQLLIKEQRTADAKHVWDRLIALRQPFSTSQAFPYFRFLLAQQEVAAAQNGWLQLADLNHSLQPYLPTPDNLLVNGGFEENLLNGGFDWWYQPSRHVALAIDTNEFHSGTRSLSVTFDGRSTPDAGIFQLVPVRPNTDYEFSGEFRSEELDTASGPRFAISDAYTNASYVLTDDALGTNPWRLQRAAFHTGPNTNLLLVKISRQPPQPLIRGKLWIDDLKLVEKPKQGSAN